MLSGYYLLLLMQLCIGALVGMSASKQFPGRGLAIAILLGMAGIIEFEVIDALLLGRTETNFFARIAARLVFDSVLWSVAILFVCVGYGLGFWASGRLGVGGWQFGIPTLLAFVAIYAVVAAIARTM
jgi:hypothetical protein